MAAYNITIKGQVQDLGYRDQIRDRGRALKLCGHVYNSRNGSVRIAAKPSPDSSQTDVNKFIQEVPEIGETIGADIENFGHEEIEGDPYLPYPFVKAPTDDLSDIGDKLDDGVEAIRDNHGVLEAVKDDTEAMKNNTDSINDLVEGQTQMITVLEDMASSLETLGGEEEV